MKIVAGRGDKKRAKFWAVRRRAVRGGPGEGGPGRGGVVGKGGLWGGRGREVWAIPTFAKHRNWPKTLKKH